MSDLEKTAHAAHVVLDIVSSYDGTSDWQTVTDAALPRLVDVGAVRVWEHEDSCTIDFGPLVRGATMLIERLMAQIHHSDDVARDELVVQLRDWIDEHGPDAP